MPSVRNLVSDKPTREAVAVTAANTGAAAEVGTAEAAGLVPVNAAAAGVMALVDQFDALPTLPGNDGVETADAIGGVTGTYIGFAHPRNNQWENLRAAGLVEGDIYLCHDGQVTKCMPLNYWVVKSVIVKTKQDTRGTIVAATRDLAVESPRGELPNWQEHVLALILVDLGNRIVPAKADFRGTKSPAIAPLLRQVKAAGDPEWLKGGDPYRVAAAFSPVWGRVVGRANTRSAVNKAGDKYHLGTCAPVPATVDQLTRLTRFLGDPAAVTVTAPVAESYRDRLNQIVAAFGKG